MDLLDIRLGNNGISTVSPLGTPRNTREVVVATAVDLAASMLVVSVTAAAVPNGATVTVGATPITVGQTATVNAGSLSLSLDTIGAYRLVLTFSAGARDLNLFGIEAAALTAVVAQSPIVRTPLTLQQQTQILRAVINEGPGGAFFTGSAASLANHTLVPFGA